MIFPKFTDKHSNDCRVSVGCSPMLVDSSRVYGIQENFNGQVFANCNTQKSGSSMDLSTNGSSLLATVNVKVEPLNENDSHNIENDILLENSLYIQPLLTEPDIPDQIYEDILDHMLLRDRMKLLTAAEIPGSTTPEIDRCSSDILPSFIYCSPEAIEPTTIKGSLNEKETVIASDFAEAALKEIPPVPMEMSRGQGGSTTFQHTNHDENTESDESVHLEVDNQFSSGGRFGQPLQSGSVSKALRHVARHVCNGTPQNHNHDQEDEDEEPIPEIPHSTESTHSDGQSYVKIPTTCHSGGCAPHIPTHIVINQDGQSFDPSVSRAVGAYVRLRLSPQSYDWSHVPDADKMFYWQQFQKNHTWDPTKNKKVYELFWKLCKRSFSQQMYNVRTPNRLQKTPVTITTELQEAWKKKWDSEKYKNKKSTNKKNRAEGSLHTGGSIPFTLHQKRMIAEAKRLDQPEPTWHQVYEQTHYKDGAPIDERARKFEEDWRRKLDEAHSQHDIRESSEQPTPIDESQIFFDAAGGRVKKRIYGLGSAAARIYPDDVGTSPSDIGHSSRRQTPAQDAEILRMRAQLDKSNITIAELQQRIEAVSSLVQTEVQRQVREALAGVCFPTTRDQQTPH